MRNDPGAADHHQIWLLNVQLGGCLWTDLMCRSQSLLVSSGLPGRRKDAAAHRPPIQSLICCCGSETPFCFSSIQQLLVTSRLKTRRHHLLACTLSSWAYTCWPQLRCLGSSINLLWGAAAPFWTACPFLLVCSSLVS